MIVKEDVIQQMIEVIASRLDIDYLKASEKITDEMVEDVIQQMEFAFDNEVAYIMFKEGLE